MQSTWSDAAVAGHGDCILQHPGSVYHAHIHSQREKFIGDLLVIDLGDAQWLAELTS